jgi:hypothetical protein
LAQFQRLSVYVANLFPHFFGEPHDEILDKHRNIFLPFAKRWHLDWEDIESVKKIRSECPCGDRGRQIAICCRNYANIRWNDAATSHSLKLTLLQHPQ